jgi:hypothetical protein
MGGWVHGHAGSTGMGPAACLGSQQNISMPLYSTLTVTDVPSAHLLHYMC